MSIIEHHLDELIGVHHMRIYLAKSQITFGCLAWVYTPKESCKNKLVPRSEQMSFIGYDMGAKAYRFMQKDNSMVIAVKCLFEEDTFPRAKSENGTSNQNKLKMSPPGNIEKDLEEIYIPPNPKNNDINHDHEDPHDENSSDDTPSESQESSPSEEESDESEERKSFKSMESEDSSSEKEKSEQSSSDSSSEEE